MEGVLVTFLKEGEDDKIDDLSLNKRSYIARVVEEEERRSVTQTSLPTQYKSI